MRNLSRAGTLTLVAGLALALAGCVPQPYPIVPTSQPTVAPVFKSDAAALAAAKKAYEGYLAASDAIARDGGRETSSLAELDTPKQLALDEASFARLAAANQHISGQSAYSHFTLQHIEQSAKGRVEIYAYSCIDVSGTHLLDEANNDITPDGNNVLPLQLTFVNVMAKSRALLVDGSETWSGNNFCL
jgi:hypothetical protein